MSQVLQKSPSARTNPTGNKNPFASALAQETIERDANFGSNPPSGIDAFRDALMRGQNREPSSMSTAGNSDMQTEGDSRQQQEWAEQQKLEALRRNLNKEVNPTQQTEVYAARAAEVKKNIESLRTQLGVKYYQPLKQSPEANKTLKTALSEQSVGDGSYLSVFYHHLQIVLEKLRVYLSAPRDSKIWSNTAKNKNAKKGLGKGGHKTTKSVQDTFHHEQAAGAQGAG